ncbi:MAG: 23S rRNA (uracil(1939)-C(5))-methyltransferase RlmD [Persicimonas sp.]
MDDTQRVEIARMTQEGDGIGYLEDGRIVFVPRTLPDEVVDIELVELKKSFGRGKVVEIVEAVEERVESDCPYFIECGGCQFWHTDYETEIELKAEGAWQNIKRISHLDVPEPTVILAPRDRRYRSRVTFHRERAGEGEPWQIGFYKAGSNDLVEVEDCPITLPILNEARRGLELPLRDAGDCDIILETADNQSVVATIMPERNFRTKMPPSLKKFLKTIDEIPLFRGVRVIGDDEDVVHGDITVDADQVLADSPVDEAMLPSGNFRQAYREMNVELTECVRDVVEELGVNSLLELYSGSGNLSFALREHIERLVGLEGNPSAVESAQGLAKLAELEGFEFRVADLSGGFVQRLDDRAEDFDAVLLDPPRAGAAPVAKELARFEDFDAIVYVSCDSACLARDLKTLDGGGWEVESLTMLDMFPRTGHIETVAVLK